MSAWCIVLTPLCQPPYARVLPPTVGQPTPSAVYKRLVPGWCICPPPTPTCSCLRLLTDWCPCCGCLLPMCCRPQYNDQILQLFTSSLFLAGAFAALVAMVTSKKLGRRFTMVCGGLAFIIGKHVPGAAATWCSRACLSTLRGCACVLNCDSQSAAQGFACNGAPLPNNCTLGTQCAIVCAKSRMWFPCGSQVLCWWPLPSALRSWWLGVSSWVSAWVLRHRLPHCTFQRWHPITCVVPSTSCSSWQSPSVSLGLEALRVTLFCAASYQCNASR